MTIGFVVALVLVLHCCKVHLKGRQLEGGWGKEGTEQRGLLSHLLMRCLCDIAALRHVNLNRL